MLKALKSVWAFINYWYFRYLMVTELYMVEKWERAVCNFTIVVFMCILSYFNYIVLYYATAVWNYNFKNYTIFS